MYSSPFPHIYYIQKCYNYNTFFIHRPITELCETEHWNKGEFIFTISKNSALFLQDTCCLDHDRMYFIQSLYHKYCYSKMMYSKTIISMHPIKNIWFKDNIIWSF